MLKTKENMEMQKHVQVVLVPCPLVGHFTPMLELASILHSKGFSVIIMHAMFNPPNPSHYPDFHFQPILENLIFPNPEHILEFYNLINTHGEDSLRNAMNKLVQQNSQQDNKVACIIYDIVMRFTQVTANSMNLPSIIFNPAGAAFHRAYDAIPRLFAERIIPVQDTMLENQVPELHPLRFKDLSISGFGNFEDTIQMFERSTNTGTLSAIIWNTMDYLEHSALSEVQKVYQVPIFPIGPLHKMAPTTSINLIEEDTTCITWLENQASLSVIYVSLGSLANIEEKTLVEMAYGLANSSQPFLWVIRPGSVRNSEWTELLPEDFRETIGERGRIVKWAPQREVLAHAAVGCFWSHCGWNSTLESISEGVPLLCMPSFADQNINARYVSHEWKIGLHLEQDLQRGNIEKAIKLLMLDKEGEEMRLRANFMKEKINTSVKKDGASYNKLNELLTVILSM